MTEIFENWTAYDEWLVQNYNDVTVEKLEEREDKTISASFQKKNAQEQK